MLKLKKLSLTAAAVLYGLSAFTPSFAAEVDSAEAADIQVTNDLPIDFKAQIEEQENEPLIQNNCGVSSVDSGKLREIYHQYKRVKLKKGSGNRKTKKAMESFACARDQVAAAGITAESASAPAWSTEELSDEAGHSIQLHDFLSRLQGWAKGTLPVKPTDQALNFAPTSNNKLELHFGHEDYHAALFQDLNNARNSINMQMFGVVADDYGWTMAKTLAQKAKEGLKVRFMTDKFGARLTFINKVPKNGEAGPIEPMLKFMKDAGVEVLITYDRPTAGLFHYDHRKSYIIDGQIGWNVGYTIENAMRHKNFDQGTRIHGDLTRQMQATWFSSWLAFGGKLPELKDDAVNFMSRYFPEPSETGSAKVKLVDNLPRAQQDITEGYYERIANAKSQVMVTNLYFGDIRFAKALLQAKKNGADVTIIVEADKKKMFFYNLFTEFWFRKFDKAGIHTYWFHGEEGYGLSHAKVVLADNFVSTGSCNFDLFSLYHNGEQNIETEDPDYVNAIRTQFFPTSLKYSTAYERPKGFFKNLGVTLKGLLGESYGLIF